MENKVIVAFENPGLYTSIQDLGRPGHQSSGIPVGGVLDRASAMKANYLVGNAIETPVLEITLLGPKMKFYGDCQVAICGANLSPKLDFDPIENEQTIDVKSGSLLRFMKPVKGCRAYLAIGGEWQVPSWLGSTSLATVHWKTLTPQSKIEKNAELEIHRHPFIEKRKSSSNHLGQLEAITIIPVLAGPEFDRFSRKDIAEFFSRNYQITPSSNRMGYRLNPSLADYSWPFTSISSGVIPGTIQITNGGQAIILLADAQTVGGYPRIAHVTEMGLNLLAQLRPGDRLKFQFEK